MFLDVVASFVRVTNKLLVKMKKFVFAIAAWAFVSGGSHGASDLSVGLPADGLPADFPTDLPIARGSLRGVHYNSPGGLLFGVPIGQGGSRDVYCIYVTGRQLGIEPTAEEKDEVINFFDNITLHDVSVSDTTRDPSAVLDITDGMIAAADVTAGQLHQLCIGVADNEVYKLLLGSAAITFEQSDLIKRIFVMTLVDGESIASPLLRRNKDVFCGQAELVWRCILRYLSLFTESQINDLRLTIRRLKQGFSPVDIPEFGRVLGDDDLRMCFFTYAANFLKFRAKSTRQSILG
jgi:hypothetical protein